MERVSWGEIYGGGELGGTTERVRWGENYGEGELG